MGPGKPTFLDLGSSITRRETHDWTPRATNCMPGSPNPGQVPGYSHLPAGLLSFSTPKRGRKLSYKETVWPGMAFGFSSSSTPEPP